MLGSDQVDASGRGVPKEKEGVGMRRTQPTRDHVLGVHQEEHIYQEQCQTEEDVGIFFFGKGEGS